MTYMSKQRSVYKAALDQLYAFLSGYSPLERSEFEQLLPYIEIREFDKKVQVIGVGEVEGYLNIIARGLVRKYLPIRNKEVTIQLAKERHIVNSELSFHYRTPSGAVVETIEPTIFLSISYDSLQQLFDKFPKAERLGRLMVSQLYIRTDLHYFDLLQKSTRERFLAYVRSHPQMLQRVPQKYIASYLNIKPETFSRLKHLLRKR
jgi:CRP-like cAMP-binding protein